MHVDGRSIKRVENGMVRISSFLDGLHCVEKHVWKSKPKMSHCITWILFLSGSRQHPVTSATSLTRICSSKLLDVLKQLLSFCLDWWSTLLAQSVLSSFSSGLLVSNKFWRKSFVFYLSLKLSGAFSRLCFLATVALLAISPRFLFQLMSLMLVWAQTIRH